MSILFLSRNRMYSSENRINLSEKQRYWSEKCVYFIEKKKSTVLHELRQNNNQTQELNPYARDSRPANHETVPV